MLKTNEKQHILHAFNVLGVLVRVFVSWTTLLCIDDLVRLWRPGVGLGIQKKIETDVGLEFQL